MSKILEMCRVLYVNVQPVEKGIVELVSAWITEATSEGSFTNPVSIEKMSLADISNFVCLAILLATDSPITHKAVTKLFTERQHSLELPTLLNFFNFFKSARVVCQANQFQHACLLGCGAAILPSINARFIEEKKLEKEGVGELQKLRVTVVCAISLCYR